MATRLAVGVAAALLAAAAAAPSVDLPTFLAAGDLAQLFPSMPTATLTLPTELHILFIGFSGESLPAVNTTDEELTPWFQQLRAILPHTVLGEPPPEQPGGPPPTALQYACLLYTSPSPRDS